MHRFYRSIRHWLVAHLLRFEFWQARGVHILPVTFDMPVPDTGRLDPSLWTRTSELPGIDLREDEQLAWLERFRTTYRSEYEQFPRQPTGEEHRYHVDNGGFESVDGEVLWSMIREHKPRRIYEIGSGNSTKLAAEAVRRNEADGSPPCELVAFEPFPNDVLQRGFPGLTRLVRTGAQDIPLATFDALEEDDILFIDSSHVLKIGSDVHHLFLEVLPRLRPGVIVHVHDVFLPAEYPREWIVRDHRFWNEQYLLQAYLSGNTSVEVLWAASFLHLRHPDRLEAAFPSYDRARRWPGSFWMRRVS
jgi:hypothetical protein